MKAIMKNVVALALALCMVVLLCACGAGEKAPAEAPTEAPAATPNETPAPQQEEEVTLTFWHTYSEGEEEIFLSTIVPAFEEANPGIKIDSIRMPLDGLQQQILTGASGDAAPDVMRMDLTWVSGFAKMGALQDVSGFEGFDAIKDNAQKASMDTNYYNGGYYGLPLNSNTTCAIWNLDLLAEFGITEIPTTLDEVVALAKEHNDPANEKFVFTIAGTYTWAMLPYFWSLGGELTNEDFSVATGHLNSDASAKALDTIAGWYKDGVISGAIIGEQPDAWGGMTGGKYCFVSEGPWFFSSNDSGFATETTVMPAGEGGSISIVGGEDIVMFNSSKNQEAAWKFMQFMLSDDAQLAMTNAGMIPTTKTASEKMDTSATPYLRAYLDQLANAKARTPSANWGDIDALLGMAFESVVRGEQTAKEALDQIAPEIDQLLK